MKQFKITHEELRSELDAGVTVTEISRKYDISQKNLYKRINKLKATGYDPANNRFHKNPEEQIVKGYSDLVRMKDKGDTSTGTVLSWVKTNIALQDQIDTAKDIMEAMHINLKPLPIISFENKVQSKDRFTCIPIGDPHIGLQTWQKQVGVEWNLEIAERVYTKVFKRLLSSLPDTEECVLVNTGDFFHTDNIECVTTRSKHKLDVAGLHGDWIKSGLMLMGLFINLCLKKYKRVEFINVPGNHDDLLGRFLGEHIDILYSNNPRLTVQKGDDPFQYVHKGEVLLGFAHGHNCKLAALPGKMADDQYKLWGLSTYRHWITGHVHHNHWVQFKEHPGCKLESVGIIPPKDSYSYGGGYGAGRGIQGLVFDKKYGYLPIRIQESVRDTD